LSGDAGSGARSFPPRGLKSARREFMDPGV
jgi:hypothetical protein